MLVVVSLLLVALQTMFAGASATAVLGFNAVKMHMTAFLFLGHLAEIIVIYCNPHQLDYHCGIGIAPGRSSTRARRGGGGGR